MSKQQILSDIDEASIHDDEEWDEERIKAGDETFAKVCAELFNNDCEKLGLTPEQMLAHYDANTKPPVQ